MELGKVGESEAFVEFAEESGVGGFHGVVWLLVGYAIHGFA